MSPQVFCKSAWIVTIVAFVKTHENLLIFLASLQGSYKNAFVVAMVAFLNTVCESSSFLQKFMCSHKSCICKTNVL